MSCPPFFQPSFRYPFSPLWSLETGVITSPEYLLHCRLTILEARTSKTMFPSGIPGEGRGGLHEEALREFGLTYTRIQ